MKNLHFYLLLTTCLFYLASCNHGGGFGILSPKDSTLFWEKYNKDHGIKIPNVYKPRWGDMSNWSQYMLKDDANNEITNYLSFIYNNDQVHEVRSFFINADTIRNYLNRNKNVTDIQVFGALNEINGIIRREYVFIGVNKNTTSHVYVKDAMGRDCVFENCLPCPSFCDRVTDDGGHYTLE